MHTRVEVYVQLMKGSLYTTVVIGSVADVILQPASVVQGLLMLFLRHTSFHMSHIDKTAMVPVTGGIQLMCVCVYVCV